LRLIPYRGARPAQGPMAEEARETSSAYADRIKKTRWNRLGRAGRARASWCLFPG